MLSSYLDFCTVVGCNIELWNEIHLSSCIAFIRVFYYSNRNGTRTLLTSTYSSPGLLYSFHLWHSFNTVCLFDWFFPTPPDCRWYQHLIAQALSKVWLETKPQTSRLCLSHVSSLWPHLWSYYKCPWEVSTFVGTCVYPCQKTVERRPHIEVLATPFLFFRLQSSSKEQHCHCELRPLWQAFRLWVWRSWAFPSVWLTRCWARLRSSESMPPG